MCRRPAPLPAVGLNPAGGVAELGLFPYRFEMEKQFFLSGTSLPLVSEAGGRPWESGPSCLKTQVR